MSSTFSPTKAGSVDKASGIQVVVRLRPMNERELQRNTLPVVSASTENREVTVIRNNASQTLRNQFRYDLLWLGTYHALIHSILSLPSGKGQRTWDTLVCER